MRDLRVVGSGPPGPGMAGSGPPDATGPGDGSPARSAGVLVESGRPAGGGGASGSAPGSFEDALRDAAGSVGISRHAARRLEERGIELQDDQRARLRQAMDTLAGKGGHTSLVMLGGVAYVVDVPSQRVVTAVKAGEGKEAVFTKIDSVVVA